MTNDVDRSSKMTTEKCPLDLATWKSLLTLIIAILVELWHSSLSRLDSRENNRRIR